MHDDYDRSSKWILQHHGNSVLFLAGVRAIRSWKTLQAEVVQPRQLPDGLLEVFRKDKKTPDLYVVEIATYPEKRMIEQVFRDAMLVYLDRRQLPEVLTVVLRPRGSAATTGIAKHVSPGRWCELQLRWRVVEVWTLSAKRLLAAEDIGLVPWVPLAKSDEPPETLLRKCREKIERLAPQEERLNLLAVTQVLTRLRYNRPGLLEILGGTRVMIESPLIQEMLAKARHEDIVRILVARFDAVPDDLKHKISAIQGESRLNDLVSWAARCSDLASFRSRLTANGSTAKSS
jgi:predicted transposase YdaD